MKKLILSFTLALLILSWLFPWVEYARGEKFGQFAFLFGRQLNYQKVEFAHLFLTDMMIIAAGGIAFIWIKGRNSKP